MGRITVFTRSDDLNSRQLVKELEQRSLPYVEIDVAEYPSKQADLQVVGVGVPCVPQVFFNTRYIGGLRACRLELQQSWDSCTRYHSPFDKYQAEIASGFDPNNIHLALPLHPNNNNNNSQQQQQVVVQEPTAKARKMKRCMKLPDGSTVTIRQMLEHLQEWMALRPTTRGSGGHYQQQQDELSFTGRMLVSCLEGIWHVSKLEAIRFAERLSKEGLIRHVDVQQFPPGHRSSFKYSHEHDYYLQCHAQPNLLNSYLTWPTALGSDKNKNNNNKQHKTKPGISTTTTTTDPSLSLPSSSSLSPSSPTTSTNHRSSIDSSATTTTTSSTTTSNNTSTGNHGTPPNHNAATSNSVCVWSLLETVNNLHRLLTVMELSSLDPDSGRINMHHTVSTLAQKFVKFEETACELQAIPREAVYYPPSSEEEQSQTNPSLVHHAWTAMALNLYSVMIRYAYIKLGIPVTEADRQHFLSHVKFCLAGDEYSLQEWINLILIRTKMSRRRSSSSSSTSERHGPRRSSSSAQSTATKCVAFGDKDMNHHVREEEEEDWFDRRILLALFVGPQGGSEWSLPFARFSAEHLQEELNIAARVFCLDDQYIAINRKGNQIDLLSAVYLEELRRNMSSTTTTSTSPTTPTTTRQRLSSPRKETDRRHRPHSRQQELLLLREAILPYLSGKKQSDLSTMLQLEQQHSTKRSNTNNHSIKIVYRDAPEGSLTRHTVAGSALLYHQEFASSPNIKKGGAGGAGTGGSPHHSSSFTTALLALSPLVGKKEKVGGTSSLLLRKGFKVVKKTKK